MFDMLFSGVIMKLYILSALPTGRTAYDSYDSFVVVAENEAEARELAANSAGDEGSITWRDPLLSDCEEMLPTGEKRIILGSFNAG
jgi:hypothetical protein